MNLTRMFNDTAVHWTSRTPDGFGGGTYAGVAEIACRWEDKQVMFVDASGKEQMSNALVYAETDFTLDDWLYLGEESDLASDHDDPTDVSDTVGLFVVRKFDKVGNVSGTQYLRVAYL